MRLSQVYYDISALVIVPVLLAIVVIAWLYGGILQLSDWVEAHQAIVVTFGIPVLTAATAGIVSLSTTRMNASEKEKDREMQRAFRQAEICRQQAHQLRELFAQFSALTFYTSMDLREGLSSGEKGAISKERVSHVVEQLIELMCKIMLLIERDDPDARALSQAMELEMRAVADSSILKDQDHDNKFARVSARILSRLEKEALGAVLK